MKQLPEKVSMYKQTSEFNENTIPDGLLKEHQTKAGTWAKIIILQGNLAYKITSPAPEEITLTSDYFGVVEPTVPHCIKPLGPVRLYIEFYR